jgi:hypothetical protein
MKSDCSLVGRLTISSASAVDKPVSRLRSKGNVLSKLDGNISANTVFRMAAQVLPLGQPHFGPFPPSAYSTDMLSDYHCKFFPCNVVSQR